MPDGQRFLSASLDQTVRVYPRRHPPNTSSTFTRGGPRGLPDNQHRSPARGTRPSKLFNVNDGAALRSFAIHKCGGVSGAARRLRFVAAMDDGTATSRAPTGSPRKVVRISALELRMPCKAGSASARVARHVHARRASKKPLGLSANRRAARSPGSPPGGRRASRPARATARVGVVQRAVAPLDHAARPSCRRRSGWKCRRGAARPAGSAPPQVVEGARRMVASAAASEAAAPIRRRARASTPSARRRGWSPPRPTRPPSGAPPRAARAAPRASRCAAARAGRKAPRWSPSSARRRPTSTTRLRSPSTAMSSRATVLVVGAVQPVGAERLPCGRPAARSSFERAEREDPGEHRLELDRAVEAVGSRT